LQGQLEEDAKKLAKTEREAREKAVID